MKLKINGEKIIEVNKRTVPRNGVLEIPETYEGSHITGIDINVFANSKSIKKVIIPESINKIGPFCFRNSSIEEIVFKGDIKNIGYEAFAFTPNLKTVCFEKESKNLVFGDRCFFYSRIEEIDLSKTNTKEISSQMFCNTKLKNIILPSSLELIHNDAFFSCNNLESINCKTSFCNYSKTAFIGCSKLDDYYLTSVFPFSK